MGHEGLISYGTTPLRYSSISMVTMVPSSILTRIVLGTVVTPVRPVCNVSSDSSVKACSKLGGRRILASMTASCSAEG